MNPYHVHLGIHMPHARSLQVYFEYKLWRSPYRTQIIVGCGKEKERINQPKIQIEAKKSSKFFFIWTIPIRNQIGFLRSPKSIQGLFKLASPNRREGAQDQIECESKSTQHSDSNPNPNQTDFRKTTTYKIKTIGVDDLKKAWRWAQIKYERRQITNPRFSNRRARVGVELDQLLHAVGNLIRV
jgi:hypothetical protein